MGRENRKATGKQNHLRGRLLPWVVAVLLCELE